MEFFADIVEYRYLLHALLAAVFAGITCGIVGTYVVARRMVFLCGGITHSSFGGLGIALWAGVNPIAGAMAFAVLSALGIEWASDRGKMREDSAIGIMWGVGMAIGALFMSLTPGYTSGDLASYMFGSIVTVTQTDVILLGLFTLLCVVGFAVWWRQVMYLAFDREFASSQGIAVRAVSYLLIVVVAVTLALYDACGGGKHTHQVVCLHHGVGGSDCYIWHRGGTCGELLLGDSARCLHNIYPFRGAYCGKTCIFAKQK